MDVDADTSIVTVLDGGIGGRRWQEEAHDVWDYPFLVW